MTPLSEIGVKFKRYKNMIYLKIGMKLSFMPVSQYCYETQFLKSNYETAVINIKSFSILRFYDFMLNQRSPVNPIYFNYYIKYK